MQVAIRQIALMGVSMAGQLHRASNIEKFMLAGSATITLRSMKTGARFTYKVRRKGPDEFWFVSLLSGPDNESDYNYLGQIFPRGGNWVYQVGRKSKIRSDAGSQVAFSYLAQILWSTSVGVQQALLDRLEVWHEGCCGRCNRKLTVPESIASGFGPECINHV